MASGYVTEELIQWFYKKAVVLVRKPSKAVIRILLQKLYQLHEEFVQYAAQENIRLGTTVTVILILKKRYFVIHAGDSRCYQWKKRGRGRYVCRQLTRDHVANGKLYKGIGSFSWKKPDCMTGKCRKNMAFLICTDGFRHIIYKEELEQSLCPGILQREEQIEKRLAEIGKRSIAKGEKDDSSAVYVKIKE